jgi:hypothetical protein
MSNTRYAAPGAPMRQEKFASSREFNSGLLGNLVAKRCIVLPKQEDRELIWFLQELSHRTGIHQHHTCNQFPSWPWATPSFEGGGLDRVVADLIHLYPERVGTPAMRRINKTKGNYTSDEVREIREEIQGGNSDYRLKGELRSTQWYVENPDYAEAERQPEFYPVSDFTGDVTEAFEPDFDGRGGLANYLRELCLSPTITTLDTAAVWYFIDLIGSLRDYQKRFQAAAEFRAVKTSVASKVWAMIDFSLSERCMTLTTGFSRTGKSLSAQQRAQGNLGKIRYVQLETYNDECTFFRALCRAVGAPSSAHLKAAEMRNYLYLTLATGDLLLIIDEADGLFPRTSRAIVPHRIDWVNTGLVNRSIPVALIGTPRFRECLAYFDKRSPVWQSEQFKGRLGDEVALPGDLADDDLLAIAKHSLPEGTAGMHLMLVAVAKKTEGYVASIEKVVRKCRYAVKQQGRSDVTAGILKPICEEVMGIDPVTSRTASAEPVQPVCKSRAKPFPKPLLSRSKKPVNYAQAVEPRTAPLAETLS